MWKVLAYIFAAAAVAAPLVGLVPGTNLLVLTGIAFLLVAAAIWAATRDDPPVRKFHFKDGSSLLLHITREESEAADWAEFLEGRVELSRSGRRRRILDSIKR